MSIVKNYLAPNFNMIKLLILLGFLYEVYSAFCDKWIIGKIPNSTYDTMLEDLMKDERPNQIIVLNRKNLEDNKALKISKKVREEFDFPEITTQIVEGISNAADVNDPSTWDLPEFMKYFLRNFKLRAFVECALLASMPFNDINRLWKTFNPEGILRELLDQYKYFFWNNRDISKMDLRSFLKSNANNPFYHKHFQIMEKGREAFMGEYGIQTDTEREKNMREIAHKSMLKIKKNPEEPNKINHSLLELYCTYISQNKHNKNKRAGRKNQNANSSFDQQAKSFSNLSAQSVRNSNREYRFKQLLLSSIKSDNGASHG